MEEKKPTYREFAATIKEKYPQYAEVDDKELAQKIVNKYPQYKDKFTFEESVEGESGNFTEGSSEPSGEPTTEQSKGGETPSPLVQKPLPVGVASLSELDKRNKDAIVKVYKGGEEDISDYLLRKAKTGVASLTANIYRTPEFIYDVAAESYNGLLRLQDEITGIESSKLPTSEAISNKVGVDNVPAETLEAYTEAQNRVDSKYNTSIVENIQNGNYADAAVSTAGAITESLPFTLSLLIPSAMGTNALKTFSATSAVMGAGRKQELTDDERLSEGQKNANAALHGVAEGFEVLLGAGSAGRAIRDVYKNAGVKEGKRFAQQTIEKVLKDNPYLQPFSEAIQEGLTQYTQNLSDIYINNEEKDPTEGIADAMIVGAVMGSGFTGVGLGVEATQKLSRGNEQVTPKEVEVIEKVSENPKGIEQVSQEIDDMESLGEIDAIESQQMKTTLYESVDAVKSIPNNLTPEQKTKAFDLVREKRRLKQEIDGKDEALVTPQKERISQIDEELKSIVTPKTEQDAGQTKESEAGTVRDRQQEQTTSEQAQDTTGDEATTGGARGEQTAVPTEVRETGTQDVQGTEVEQQTQEQDAIQEQSTTEVDVRQQAEDGEGVGRQVRSEQELTREGEQTQTEGEATQEAEQVTPPSEEAKQRAIEFGYTAPIQAVRSVNKRLGTQYETLEEISDAELDQTTSSRTLEKIKELVGDESAVKTAITDFINDLETRGRVTTTKAANLLKSLNNTSLKSEKQVTKFLEGVSKSFSEAALAEQKKTTKSKLKQAAKKSKGKTTISSLVKDLSAVDISKITDTELLDEIEITAEELQKTSPKVSPKEVNALINKVQQYQTPQKPQESLEKRVKQNTNKRLNAKTPNQELNAEIERQALLTEYLSSSENIPIEVLQELEEPLPIDFKNRDITSYDVAKKALGDVRRALRSVDKAVEEGVIDTEKANEIRDGIREAAEKYKEEIQQQLQVEKQKYDKLKKKTKLPSPPAERYAVEQFLKTEPVDDIAWYSKANDVLESIANEVIPYKEMTDLKSYSAYQSKAAEDIAAEVEGKTIKGSIKDVTAQLSKKDASQRERNVLGIRTNLIWDNVYQPMVAAIKQAERLTDSLISDWQKVVVAPSILRKKARQQFNKDMAHIGIVMHYLQEQAMDGAGISADGVPVGNRDIFGIILGNKKAMDAAGMDADMQKNFLKEQALSNYTKSEIKLLKDAYERLKDPELGYVDVTKISPETSLTESEKKIYDESRKLFDATSEYQQAANLSRGVDFARRGMYFPTKRKGGSRGSVDKPVNIFTSFTAEATSGKEKTTYSLLTDVGGLEFMLNKVALDHAADVSLDYVFSLQQPVINSLLNSVVRKSNSSNVAMAIKNDYNESLVWQASSLSDGLTKWLTKLLGARYAKSLLDPLRSAVEIISGTLGASVKTRSLSAIGNVFDKNSWKLLNQLEQDFGIEIADFKDVELNRRSIREGLNEEMVYAKLARKIITVPEYVTAMSLFMPTFRAEFEKLTGQPFDQNKYLNDTQYRKEFQEELKTAVSRGQNFVERVQGSKVKGGTRRRVEYAPKALMDVLSTESPTSGMVGADTVFGRLIGFFGNYTYREQGEFFTSAKFVINDLLAKGKSVDKAELANAAGVLTNAIIYGYLMSLYYAGRQLVLGDEEEKEEAIEELEETHTPTGILKSIVNQIAFLGLSKFGKSSRAFTILTLSELYNIIDDEYTKESIEYVLREQFYVYKPMDLKSQQSIGVYAFKEGMPALHYLSQITQQGYKDIDEIKKDPDALVALSLAINLTNLGLATGMGTQLPMTPVINDAIKKAKKEKEKPPQQTQREPRVSIK